MVERQLQYGLFATEHVAPVVQLSGLLTGFHPRTLPYGKVGVLDRHQRQLCCLALAEGGIKLHQLVDHDVHRPTVRDDVMLHQHQHMIVLRHTH
ncbi:hypothetical protein [Pseudomonas sp. 58 R 3]|nr:hypothetical protein [Pseudomonas sp. 58 R 3]